MGPERERRLLETRGALFERVRAAIAERLLHVCAHMPPEEFDALVRRAAEIQIKYEARSGFPALR